MKTVLIILFSVVSLAASAQDSKKSPVKVDTAKAAQETLTDSTLLFSVKDLRPLYNELKKLHETQPEKYKAYVESLTNPLLMYLDGLIRERMRSYKPQKQ